MQIWSAEIKELETLYTSIKGQFPDLEKELEKLVKADDENMVLLYSRRCLEVIITDLCECELKRPRKTEPLKGIIDKLNREEKVPSHIITSMQHLNSLSTYGAYPKDFDPQQVRPVLINLTTIITWYLKYKDTQAIIKSKEEEVKSESVGPEDSTEHIQKPKKKLILLLSGLALVIVIVVVALFVFNVIGGGKRTKKLEKSIAVLPFKLLSDEPDKQYLADGMMDAILLHLSKIQDLRVISRTSVEQYRNPEKTIPEIGRELGVEYLLEGSFQKSGDNIRLIVQLIKASKDNHIWSNEYDRNWNDIFSVQSEVAQTIANELHYVITPEEKDLIERIPTNSLDAYEYYLLGKHYINLANRDEDFWLAIEYYEKAVNIDTAFALAYSGLAEAYYQLVNFAILSPNEAYPKASAFSIKALELNEKLADAHCMLGLVKKSFEYDFDGAEKEYIRALELNPRNYNTHQYYSSYLSMMGRHDEAISHANAALELAPLSYRASVRKNIVLYAAGYKNEAVRLMEEARDSFPGNIYGYWYCAVFYTDLGMYNEALSMLQTQITLMGNDNISDEIGLQGYLYGQLGQKDKAKEQLDRLDILSSEGYYIAPRTRVWIYLGINDLNKAIEMLEQSFEDHTFDPGYLQRFPSVFVEDDPRFIEFRKKVGLSQ